MPLDLKVSPQSDVPAPTPESVNFRKGDDTTNCSTCSNWSVDQKCSVLQNDTPPTALCDAYAPIEGDASGTDGLGGGGGEAQIMSALFGQ